MKHLKIITSLLLISFGIYSLLLPIPIDFTPFQEVFAIGTAVSAILVGLIVNPIPFKEWMSKVGFLYSFVIWIIATSILLAFLLDK